MRNIKRKAATLKIHTLKASLLYEENTKLMQHRMNLSVDKIHRTLSYTGTSDWGYKYPAAPFVHICSICEQHDYCYVFLQRHRFRKFLLRGQLTFLSNSKLHQEISMLAITLFFKHMLYYLHNYIFLLISDTYTFIFKVWGHFSGLKWGLWL